MCRSRIYHAAVCIADSARARARTWGARPGSVFSALASRTSFWTWVRFSCQTCPRRASEAASALHSGPKRGGRGAVPNGFRIAVRGDATGRSMREARASEAEVPAEVPGPAMLPEQQEASIHAKYRNGCSTQQTAGSQGSRGVAWPWQQRVYRAHFGAGVRRCMGSCHLAKAEGSEPGYVVAWVCLHGFMCACGALRCAGHC